MRQRGFTLLEMLIAIAIFSFVSLAAYSILTQVMESDAKSQQHSQRLQQLQRAFNMLQRDLSHISARHIRDENNEQRPFILAGEYLLESEDMGIEVTSLSWRNPMASLPRSQLQRLSYTLQDGKLIKRFYPYPDAAVGQEPRGFVLLDQVNSLKFRFHGSSGWSSTISEKNKLPKAIEVSIDVDDWGELRRVFLLAQGLSFTYSKTSQDDASNSSSSNNDNSNDGNNSGDNNSGSQPNPEDNN